VLKELISELAKINDILIIVRTNGAIIEMRSNSLNVKQKEKWITVGDNDGPCHMHIDSSEIAEARFVEEQKPNRVSYSIRFFNKTGEKQLSAVFAKMYDANMNLIPERKKLYDSVFEKFGSKKTLNFLVN